MARRRSPWACLYWAVKYFQPNAFFVNAQNNPYGRVTCWDLLYLASRR